MYKVVTSAEHFFEDAKKSLEISINSLMEDGWIPQGGLSIAHVLTYFIIAQAMVKKEK